ncbi:MAG: hypothetical protein CM1200mP15_06800 [Dehalococcoidia bacterium]|nr:MAG: hypothetical protein CM1200mP15_06800 [Dehalococcoidia bacterium]
MIEEQVTNGVALRMALLYQVSAGGYQIEEEHPNGSKPGILITNGRLLIRLRDMIVRRLLINNGTIVAGSSYRERVLI